MEAVCLFETLVFTSTHTQLNLEDQHGNFTTVRNLKYYFMPFQEGSVCKDIIFNTPLKDHKMVIIHRKKIHRE
jgi:hypothetical protein